MNIWSIPKNNILRICLCLMLPAIIALINISCDRKQQSNSQNIVTVGLATEPCNRYINNNYADKLTLIVDNNKFGFIDSTGKVVIEPKFHNAGEFSEGLAAARLNGRWGYIDYTGSYVIEPVFDYATAFRDGAAIAYIDGKSFFINTCGKKLFDSEYAELGMFKDGRAIVKTNGNKFGIINKSGKLVVDTLYSRINSFIDGLAVVEASVDTYSMGIIDTLGRTIVSMNKFEEIEGLKNGYFRVVFNNNNSDANDIDGDSSGFVDEKGTLVVVKNSNVDCRIIGDVYCGLAKVSLKKDAIKCKDDNSEESFYYGYIDVNGKIIISDTNYNTVSDFSDNRAFVKNDEWHYSLINTNGKILANRIYDDIDEHGFNNGIAAVSLNDKWGVIDTNAKFVITPRFHSIEKIVGNCIFYSDFNSDTTDIYHRTVTGIAKTDGSIIISAKMQNFDDRGFRNGLLMCQINGKLTYINNNGKIIWQEKMHENQMVKSINIDFMQRGYFCAYSKIINNDYESNGWAISSNYPKRVMDNQNVTKSNLGELNNNYYKLSDWFNLHANSIRINVRPDILTTIDNKYQVFSIFVYNSGWDTVQFNAQDSRLDMKIEARNSKGAWKDIMYLPSSWCGNSYHTLMLEPQYYWEFTMPKYDGEIATKLRICLQYISHNKDKVMTVYSNEFDGHINPGQFWRKEGHQATNIMDPYNE